MNRRVRKKNESRARAAKGSGRASYRTAQSSPATVYQRVLEVVTGARPYTIRSTYSRRHARTHANKTGKDSRRREHIRARVYIWLSHSFAPGFRSASEARLPTEAVGREPQRSAIAAASNGIAVEHYRDAARPSAYLPSYLPTYLPIYLAIRLY